MLYQFIITADTQQTNLIYLQIHLFVHCARLSDLFSFYINGCHLQVKIYLINCSFLVQNIMLVIIFFFWFY